MNNRVFLFFIFVIANVFGKLNNLPNLKPQSVVSQLILKNGFISKQNNISIIKHRDKSDKAPTYYLYVHGLGGRGRNCLNWANVGVINELSPSLNFILYDPIVFFDFPDVREKLFDPSKTDLGQNEELLCLQTNFNDLLSIIEPDSKIVLAGVSRGASTILIFAGSLKKLEHINRISMIILESPFDHVLNVVKYMMSRTWQNWNPLMQATIDWGLKTLFPKLQVEGPAPIDFVAKIPKSIPVVFIHSEKDKIIHINSSRRLYSKLIQSGHKDTYYLELNDGEHSRLLWQAHGLKYQSVIHSLYQKYDLEHNPTLAQEGKEFLTNCQPSQSDIQKLINKVKL